ncbi:hypothetical protein OUZ56_025021 [Daphnia magna]|uniref:GMP synthase n=1 Tax=Daphnia magna TaxID=35525 RepID=A0ABQ9ZK26_9CRUS|nr:hypothetical protein OUZ56_025021 [Daphnia magna]
MLQATLSFVRSIDFHKDEVRALCRELDPPAELQERHPFPGPGLSIRIIYAEEPFLEADFDETQVLIHLMVHYANIAAKEHVLLNRIEIATSEEERLIWKNCPVTTSMLPRYCLFALSVFRYRKLQKNVSGMENKA